GGESGVGGADDVETAGDAAESIVGIADRDERGVVGVNVGEGAGGGALHVGTRAGRRQDVERLEAAVADIHSRRLDHAYLRAKDVGAAHGDVRPANRVVQKQGVGGRIRAAVRIRAGVEHDLIRGNAVEPVIEGVAQDELVGAAAAVDDDRAGGVHDRDG